MGSQQPIYTDADYLMIACSGYYHLPGKLLLGMYLHNLKPCMDSTTMVLRSDNFRLLAETPYLSEIIHNGTYDACIRFLKPNPRMCEHFKRYRLTLITLDLFNNCVSFSTDDDIYVETYSTMKAVGNKTTLDLENPKSISRIVELFVEYHGANHAGSNRRRPRQEQALLGFSQAI